ncbi:porin [Shewanella sp. SNU WT4]|uniref:porin n=1 Tax=Shewanella sp. SNU WT4 TaxID=2590015 RepID=UPI00143CD8DC|nr:porin [Shewanella sp. SNU WT4]
MKCSRKNRHLWGVVFFACAFSLVSKGAIAESSPEIDWSGFATLGVTYRDHHDLFFHRDYSLNADDEHFSVKSDSLLGLQTNVQLSDEWDAMGQVVWQDSFDNDLANALQWAFVRYRPNHNWVIRVGRIGLDLYMMSEYRNVDYAYIWSRPFTEFYGLTSSISRIDGADISYFTALGEYDLELKLAYGSNEFKLQGADNPIMLSLDGNLAFTASLRNETMLWRFAIAKTSLTGESVENNILIDALNQIPHPFWPAASDIAAGLVLDDRQVNYFALGFQYDSGPWLFQTELGYTDSSWIYFQSNINGYGALAYRYRDFTGFGAISHIENTEDAATVPPPSSLVQYLPPNFQAQIDAIYDGTSMAVNSARVSQTGYSLGVRWDFYPKMALKLQWDYFLIDDSGSALWQRKTDIKGEQNVNLVSLNWNMVF